MKDAIKKVIKQNIKQPIVFAVISGAHLYGFESVDSDVDIRACHLPELKGVLRYSQVPDTLDIMLDPVEGLNEADIVSHSLLKFIHLLKKPNGYLLEQLYSPLVIQTSSYHQQLKELCSIGVCKELSHHYKGFFKNQEAMMDRQQHKDIKLVLYQLRIISTAVYAARTGRIECNINTLNEELEIFDTHKLAELITLKQKQEKSQFQDMSLKKYWLDEIDQKKEMIEELAQSSLLPHFDKQLYQERSFEFISSIMRISYDSDPSGLSAA